MKGPSLLIVMPAAMMLCVPTALQWCPENGDKALSSRPSAQEGR